MGKTALLQSLPPGVAEVVSADALQVYRGLDIGTAKPDQNLLEVIPHHLIDIIDPDTPFTVGDFVPRCEQAVAAIAARGKIPIISGGTAFYIRQLLTGLPVAPKADATIREKLAHYRADHGLAACRSWLKAVDPMTAERLGGNDSYRIMRALEVFVATGFPLSAYPVPENIRNDYDITLIGLHRERSELYRRINGRVLMMFEQGLPDEVRRLKASGARPEWPGMKGIGYREFFQAAASGEFSIRGIAELISRNSRRYAKRQTTFFRSLPDVRWLHPEDDFQAILATILG